MIVTGVSICRSKPTTRFRSTPPVLVTVPSPTTAVLESGPGALAGFHAASVQLARNRTPDWQKMLAQGAERQAAATRQQLQSLEIAESFYLQEARTTMGKRKTRRI